MNDTREQRRLIRNMSRCTQGLISQDQMFTDNIYCWQWLLWRWHRRLNLESTLSHQAKKAFCTHYTYRKPLVVCWSRATLIVCKRSVIYIAGTGLHVPVLTTKHGHLCKHCHAVSMQLERETLSSQPHEDTTASSSPTTWRHSFLHPITKAAKAVRYVYIIARRFFVWNKASTNMHE